MIVVNEDKSITDFDKLDPYSRRAARLVLDRFPTWRECIFFHQPDGYPQPFIDFKVACPSPAVKDGLLVSTADNEMTVGFHTHHSHFNDFENPLDQEHILQALDHVQELIDEKVVILSWYVGERMAASSTHRIMDGNVPTSWISKVTRTTVRSWLGTYDQDAEPTLKVLFKRIF